MSTKKAGFGNGDSNDEPVNDIEAESPACVDEKGESGNGDSNDEPVNEIEANACAGDAVDAIAEAVDHCAESPACVDETAGAKIIARVVEEIDGDILLLAPSLLHGSQADRGSTPLNCQETSTAGRCT